MDVFVLLFNAGTASEGIHALRVGDRDIVLMFEDEDDATRYALLLEAQDFPAPSVETVPKEEVEAFCESANYDCRLVPQGFVPETEADRLLLVPPEQSMDLRDWDESDFPAAAETDTADPKEADDDRAYSDDELNQIRQRLEGLL